MIYLLRIFSENWIIPGLERFNTFQNDSKRFKTVQNVSMMSKAFRKMRNAETPLSWTLPFLGDRAEVKTAFQWIERLKESGCGTGRNLCQFALSSF
jgi:hypothetical protein